MSEKTEQPTPKRLRDARKKGQVAVSKEVSSAASMIGVFGFFWTMGDHYYQHLEAMIGLPARFYTTPFEHALKEVLDGILSEMILMVLPVLGLVVTIVVLAYFFQVGVLFAAESIKPSLKKINPASGVKKIFSVKNLIELVKSVVKILFLSLLLYLVISGALDSLLKIPRCGIHCIPGLLGALLMQVAVYATAAFVIIATADYWFQKFQHIKQLKMSKDEVKREYKEMEGDPQIKGKRRQLQQELAMSNMVENVKKSSVVITNPTRIAVAVQYREGETALPVVRAKGENLLARRIIEIAREEGIPIMENVPLARALHEQARIDEFIPSDLLEAVAEVLRWVNSLENQRP